jgi:hypothetical protein
MGGWVLYGIVWRAAVALHAVASSSRMIAQVLTWEGSVHVPECRPGAVVGHHAHPVRPVKRWDDPACLQVEVLHLGLLLFAGVGSQVAAIGVARLLRHCLIDQAGVEEEDIAGDVAGDLRDAAGARHCGRENRRGACVRQQHAWGPLCTAKQIFGTQLAELLAGQH